MKQSQLKLFLEKFAAEAASDQEKFQFLEWLKTLPVEEVERVLDQYSNILDEKYPPGEEVNKELFAGIEAVLDEQDNYPEKKGNRGKVISIPLFYKIAAASLLIFMLAIAGYFVLKTASPSPLAKTKQLPAPHNGWLPGTNKAVLTLADNSVVVLDDSVNGQIARQGTTRIAKLANGQLIYNAAGNDKPAQLLFNTLTTPKGGQFKLTLPDGSKVWLNAASSIRYPIAFTGNKREVYITGEAYFEVVHDNRMPFHVVANGMDVEDIGTSFNINAYDNEAVIKATLVEGEIKVAMGNREQHLLPGQQTFLDQSGKFTLIKNADVELAIAWKNGFTKFKSADIESIMRQVERWYDIEVVYEGNIPVRNFTGGVTRDSNLSELLKILELSNIHFRKDGKKLIVTP